MQGPVIFQRAAGNNDMETKEGLVFVHYMKCPEPMNKIEEASGCARLRRSTSDEVGYLKMEEEEVEVPRSVSGIASNHSALSRELLMY